MCDNEKVMVKAEGSLPADLEIPLKKSRFYCHLKLKPKNHHNLKIHHQSHISKLYSLTSSACLTSDFVSFEAAAVIGKELNPADSEESTVFVSVAKNTTSNIHSTGAAIEN